MTASFIIRGLAIPTGKTRHIGNGVIEYAEIDAFAAMIQTGRRVDVLWQSHATGAPVLATSAKLFSDPVHLGGLAFEATAPHNATSRMAMAEICAGRVAACSVNFRSMKTSSRLINGMSCRVVDEAVIDHIAVVAESDAAYGGLTSVWRADTGAGLKDAPWRIQELDRRFELGLAAWRASARREAVAVSARARRLAPVEAFIRGDRSFRAMAALASFKLPAPARRIPL